MNDKQKDILDFLDDNTTTDLVTQVIEKPARKKKEGWQTPLQPILEKGDNSKYIAQVLFSKTLPRVNMNDPQEVEDRITLYFKTCQDNDMKPTLTGCANSLGVTRQTLHSICKEHTRKMSKQTEIVQRLYSTLEELWELWMVNGKINPVSGIFLGKNNFGYKDQQEVVVTPNNPLGDTEDPEDVKAKYADVIEVDDTEN